MPCNTDYYEPAEVERAAVTIARLRLYAMDQLDRVYDDLGPTTRVNLEALRGAKDFERRVITMCALLRALTEEQMDFLVYDGRSPFARELADWWQRHEEADDRRKAQERALAQLETETETDLVFEPGEFEAYVVMQARSTNTVYPALEKTDERLYFTLEDAKAAARKQTQDLASLRRPVRVLIRLAAAPLQGGSDE